MENIHEIWFEFLDTIIEGEYNPIDELVFVKDYESKLSFLEKKYPEHISSMVCDDSCHSTSLLVFVDAATKLDSETHKYHGLHVFFIPQHGNEKKISHFFLYPENKVDVIKALIKSVGLQNSLSND